MDRRFLFFLILIFIFSFLFQQFIPVVKLDSLHGYSITRNPQQPEWDIDSFRQGRYQTEMLNWANGSIGFRSILIRTHNQIGYWLYNHSYTNDVIVGKNKFLFGKKYIDAYTGADFLGEEELEKKVELVHKLQDSLSAHNIQFLFVLAPGKASFFNEYIPDKYVSNSQGQTNYKVISRLLREKKVNHLDLKKWFESRKGISKYPLFPKCGIHWSTYGAALAADTIIKEIEKLTRVQMSKMKFDTIIVSADLNPVDHDVGLGMNLLWEIENFPMAYPSVSYSNEPKKIRLLTVADSYNWTMPLVQLSDSVFKEMNFLFCNKQLFVINDFTYETKEIDRVGLTLNHDVVMYLATDANYSEFGWGFFEEVFYKNFKLRSETGMPIPYEIANIMNRIQHDQEWLKLIKGKAIEKNISLDSAVYLDALYVRNMELKENKNGVQ